MAKNREIVATYIATRNVFDNGDPDDPDYRRTIIATAELAEPEAEITIKGDALEHELQPGMTYRFYGGWKKHWKYGDQFHFQCFVAETPATEEGVIAYLGQLSKAKLDPHGDLGLKRGIGKGTAYMLWEQYGPDAINRLRERPGMAAEDIPKLTLDVAKAAAEWLKRNQALERAKVDLIGLLDGRGFPKRTIDNCIFRYGSKAATVIRRNPYLLMQFRGCGFRLTDKLYLDLGHNPARLKRQALCAWSMIARDTDGHTWFRLPTIESKIRANVGGDQARADRAMQLALRGQLLAVYTDNNGQKWVAEERKANNERRVAEFVSLAMQETADWRDIYPDGLSNHQFAQLTHATQRTIGCLAGGPGTGKTYTTAALIKTIGSIYGYDQIAVCAPTGKAAVRLSEAMQDNGVPMGAITIHRLLKVQSSDGGWSFEHNEKNPLEQRFVFIDESSMIDTDLMASLLAARSPDAHFLFIGDHRQLAPVGHGCPFLDLQRAGVPTGELTEVRRNSGQIVRACDQMRQTQTFETSAKIDPDNGDNLFCWAKRTPEEQINGLQQFYGKYSQDEDIDLVWDIQVLVAVNKKSPLGRKPLNEKLQALLNPNGRTAKGNPFRVGDKIINLKNGNFPCSDPSAPEADPDGNIFVANGEQAEVLQVEPARTIARLQSPERCIIIPHGQKDDSEGDDDDKGTAGSWDLGYAISVHKSQGSEWPVTVLMIDEYPGAKFLCSRNWLYTAISRAKRLCLMIGQEATAKQMAKRDGLRRKTFLVEQIEITDKNSGDGAAISEEEFLAIFA